MDPCDSQSRLVKSMCQIMFASSASSRQRTRLFGCKLHFPVHVCHTDKTEVIIFSESECCVHFLDSTLQGALRRLERRFSIDNHP
jgi:hypothetical protein